MNKAMLPTLVLMVLITLFSCGVNRGWNIKETPLEKKLMWDPSIDEPYLKGYNVYWSANDKRYWFVKSILDPHAVEIKLSDISIALNPSQANFFYLKAVDTGDRESEPSNTVCWGTACPQAGGQ